MDMNMRDYIFSIPNLLKEYNEDTELTKELEKVYLNSSENLILVASGSSYNACLTVKYTLREILGTNVDVFSPSNFQYYELDRFKDDLIVVISQGGYSTNCLRLLDTLKNKNIESTVITSDIDSSIAKITNNVIDYKIGIEKVGYVTRGYTGLVSFLLLFAFRLNRDKANDLYYKFIEDISNAQNIFDDILLKSKKIYENNEKNFLSSKVVHVVSSGDGLGTASEAALKIGETVKVPAYAYDLEEYIHGPNLQIDPNYTVYLIDNEDDTSDRIIELFYAVSEVTERVYIVSTRDINDDRSLKVNYNNNISRLIFNIIPFQLLAQIETDQLNKWEKHPLMKNFDKKIKSKENE